MLELAGKVEDFVLDCIGRMKENKYWKTSKDCLKESKEKIPPQFIIGGKCFTSIAVSRGKLYSNHPKIINNVHKESKELASIIINIGKI